MEDRPYIAFRRWIKEAGPLWGIIIVSACVRFYYSYHPLISDEVFNLVTIERLANAEGYGEYFFRHPPLYLFISFLASTVVGVYPQTPSYISIIFSTLSIIPLYRITERLFDKKAALWASVFLSVMPANIAYSSWIKQDAMLLFFFLVGLDFYLKERYLLSGVTVGIALLVKEFAVFFFPLSFIITALVINREGGGGKPKLKWYGWLKMSATAIILSSWWYILFGTTFYKVAGDALIGGDIRELGWHFPSWFYIKNVPADLSYPIVILFLMGVLFLIKEIYRQSLFSKYVIPFLWLAVFYLPLSFITVKAPWYTYLAMPSIAIIAGFGMVAFLNLLQINIFRLVIYFLVVVPLMFIVYCFDNVSFIRQVSGITGLDSFKKVQGKNWKNLLEKKKFWSQTMSNRGKVAFIEYKPILPYLMDIENDEVFVLKVSQFMAFDRGELLNFTRDNDIGAFVINAESLTYTEENLNNMTSLWGEPENIDSMLVFRTGDIR